MGSSSFLRLVLLLLADLYANRSESCDRKQPRLFSTRTAYDEARHTEVKVEEVPGCMVKTFYSLNRHGTRFPGADEIEDMASILPSLRDKVVANTRRVTSIRAMSVTHTSTEHSPSEDKLYISKLFLDHYNLLSLDKKLYWWFKLMNYLTGTLCSNQVAALKQWEPVFNPDLGLQNTPMGLQEMEDLGERWRLRFPWFFGNSSSVDARCGDFPRLQESAAHLFKGLLPGKNFGTCESITQDKDNILFYLDNCAHYIASRISLNDPEKLHTAEYDESPLMASMLDSLNRRLGLEPNAVTLKIAATMYEACRFEHAVYRYSPWCEAFGTEDLHKLVYRHDMKYYWRYGHGRDINYLPSCLLLTDLISAIKNSLLKDTNTQHIITRMGSSRSILPLLVRLGLFKDRSHLHTNNSRDHINRKWELGLINPFASNLVVVHYDCDSGHKVRTFLNERTVSIGGCDSHWCPVDVFLNQWEEIVKNCDYNKICDDSSLSLSDYRYDMHHL